MAGAPRAIYVLSACDVVAIVDSRRNVNPALREAADKAGTRVILGAQARSAHGRTLVSGLDVLHESGKVEHLRCDLVAMSNGWNPAIHLTTHLGGKAGVGCDALRAFLPPQQLPPGLSVVGSAAGEFGLARAIEQGGSAGAAAASDCGFDAKPLPPVTTDPEAHDSLADVDRAGTARQRPLSISRTT